MLSARLQKMKSSMKAPIITVARHRVATDGKGVTSLVCFHGCPLNCKWCINSFTLDPDTKYKEMTPHELYDIIRVDELYFIATDGGVTFGGGEPLLRADFISEFAKLYKNFRISVETSLNVPWDSVQKVIPFTDEFIIDIKDTNPDIYLKYTKKGNEVVMENLKKLIGLVPTDRIRVRLPIIPDFNNQEDVDKSRALLTDMGFTNFDMFTYRIN